MIPPKTDEFWIRAVWGPRPEATEVIASRFISLLDRLGKIDPVFGNWLWRVDMEAIAFDEIRDQLPNAIAAKISRADDGDPIPIFGYRFSVFNSEEKSPRSINVRVHAGGWNDAPYSANDVVLETSWGMVPDPAIVTFAISKAAVLALAESFDASWCFACPGALKEFWKAVPPYYRIGWISYVGPRFAHLITPPSTAIVERQPDGGLLMAATDETFSVANPAHLAAASDILAAVAPLNALPWPPPDAEPAKAGSS